MYHQRVLSASQVLGLNVVSVRNVLRVSPTMFVVKGKSSSSSSKAFFFFFFSRSGLLQTEFQVYNAVLMVHLTVRFPALYDTLAARFTLGWLKLSARKMFTWFVKSAWRCSHLQSGSAPKFWQNYDCSGDS